MHKKHISTRHSLFYLGHLVTLFISLNITSASADWATFMVGGNSIVVAYGKNSESQVGFFVTGTCSDGKLDFLIEGSGNATWETTDAQRGTISNKTAAFGFDLRSERMPSGVYAYRARVEKEALSWLINQLYHQKYLVIDNEILLGYDPDRAPIPLFRIEPHGAAEAAVVLDKECMHSQFNKR